MKLLEIMRMPTSVDVIPPGCKGVHESCLRSYHIVQLAERWLGAGVPHSILLEVIEELRQAREDSTR
jgi:hypothetical protein